MSVLLGGWSKLKRQEYSVLEINCRQANENTITWQNTKELKIRVFRVKSESGSVSPKADFPLVCRYHITTN